MQQMTRWIAALVATLAFALVACGTDGPSATGGATPTPTATTYREAEWSIAVPSGWTRREVTRDADAKKAIRYEGTNGEFFIVALDPTGSDFVSDTLWRYAVKNGDSFEVVERTPCDPTTPEHSCSLEDARFDAYVIWKGESEPPVVGGHRWYFIFGNARSPTVDLAAFESVLESIRVTA